MNQEEVPDTPNDAAARLHAAAALVQEFVVMETIRAKFMKTDRDSRLATAMNALLENAVQRTDIKRPPSFDNRGRGSGLVLVGPTGVGKSRSLERYFDKHPVLANYNDPASQSPLVSVSVPSPCTSMQLARSLLRSSGYGIERDLPTHRLWEMAFDRLDRMQRFIVHFDEMQHVVHNMPEKDLQQMADTLKNAMYNRRITLILSGVETLVPFIQFDAQLFRRMTVLPFGGVTPETYGEIEDMLEEYANAAALTVTFGGAAETADFIARLSHAALNAFGYSVVLTHLAIEHAIQNKAKTLTKEHFATIFARKTAFNADRNPFLAERWHEINCSKMFEKREILPSPAPAKRKGK